jgi:hypothetical protein
VKLDLFLLAWPLVSMNVVTRLVLYNKIEEHANLFGNLIVPFPDKDLSNDKHRVPSCDAVRPLPGQT